MIDIEDTLPEGWEVKKLGEVCEVQRGGSPRPIRKYITEDVDGVNWIKIGDTKHITKYISETNQKITKEGAQKSRYVEEGDFIISNSMSFGKPYIMKTQGCIHDGWCKLKLGSTLNKDYFYYLLGSHYIYQQFASLAVGSVVKNISGDLLRRTILPIPGLNEQKRIVKILDDVFENIEKAKKSAEENLKNAKELFESYLQNVFEEKGDDWEEKTLEEISEIFGRGKSKHRPRNDKKLYGGNYPFIQTGDIRNSGHFITQYSQTYNEIGLNQSKLWPKGTICITIAANIAETGILSFDACFPDSVIGIVLDSKQANTDYIEYLLQYFKANIQSLSQGSAQENINLATFKDKLFPMPGIEEQKIIVKILNKLSGEVKDLEEVYREKSEKLEELKKSVLERAFSGQL